MKKTNKLFLLAIGAFALSATLLVSCNKDAETISDNQNLVAESGPSITHPADIKDMDAYLLDFKEKMESVKSDEVLSIAEAEWHLTSLANFEHSNVNVQKDNIRFDTLYSKISLTNGTVSLSELNTAYSNVNKVVCDFYHGLRLENKNFTYIQVEIEKTGILKITTALTSGYNPRWYYFENDDFCDYFSPDSIYHANSNAVSELTRLFNLLKPVVNMNNGRNYFTNFSTKTFRYIDYPDTNSPSGYRLFYREWPWYFSWGIDCEDMCYYLDSYLGLAKSNRPRDKSIVSGEVFFAEGYLTKLNPRRPEPCSDSLSVTYAMLTSTVYPPQH